MKQGNIHAILNQFESRGVQTLTRLDYKALLLLISLYAVIAFSRLGDMKAPQTDFREPKGTAVLADLGEVRRISTVQYMIGSTAEKQFAISFSENGNAFGEEYAIATDRVFAWKFAMTDSPVSARFARIEVLDEGLSLLELAFLDGEGALLPIVGSDGGEALFDEQALVPESNTYMNSMYFDEKYHARAAYETVNGLEVSELTHPPLGKLIISLGIRLFGMTPFGWRFAGAFFGLLMLPLIYAFAKRVFESTLWAFFPTLLFALDFMHFTQTRIATVDTYVTFFIMAAYYCMYIYSGMSFYEAPLGKTLVPLFFSGAFMGLAVASKWQGAYAAAGLAVLFFDSLRRRRLERPGGNNRLFYRRAAVTLACCPVFFILVPLTVYCLSYIPLLNTPGQEGLSALVGNQFEMFKYHTSDVLLMEDAYPYSSFWWQWPLMLKPAVYYSDYLGDTGTGIIAFGNPAVWYCGIAAAAYCAISKKGSSDKNILFLSVGFWAQYLPWIFVSRPTYIYHFFPSVPFMVLMTAYFLKSFVWERRGGKKLTAAFAVLTAALFAIFYPVISGLPVSLRYVDTFLSWMSTWTFV